MLRSAVAVLVASAVAASCGTSGRPATTSVPANATVTRVVDGDTVVVGVDGGTEDVRLIGIDTPESVDRDRPVMCFGPEASARLAELVPPGTPVRLERDVEPRDRYGRLLAYLYRASDGLFVNLALVAEGAAEDYAYAPNVAHDGEFAAAAAAARAERRGAWAACDAPFER